MRPGVVQVITLLASMKPVLSSPDVTATSHAEGGPLSITSPRGTTVDGVSFIPSCQKPVLPLRCMQCYRTRRAQHQEWLGPQVSGT